MAAAAEPRPSQVSDDAAVEFVTPSSSVRNGWGSSMRYRGGGLKVAEVDNVYRGRGEIAIVVAVVRRKASKAYPVGLCTNEANDRRHPIRTSIDRFRRGPD